MKIYKSKGKLKSLWTGKDTGDTLRNAGKTKAKICGQMQKENRAGHAVTTRRAVDKVGVIICKTRHMNENIQNTGKADIVVGGEGHR